MTPEAQMVLAQAFAGLIGTVTTIALWWGAYKWGSRKKGDENDDIDT